MSNLQSWLNRLESLHPTEIELGLQRVAAVAHKLGVVPPAPQVITVAGTNGKGSCVATMEVLLTTAGHSVGAYTSPHLLRFNERVRIDGEEVSERQLVAAFEAIEAVRGNISLTYFEFTTLAALWLFKRAQVAFALLEVGLGGRLDAVNIIDAQVAIITSVAIDHEDWLGNDRETIGREKAGILRKSSQFVCADPHPPQSLQEIAPSLSCPSIFINRDFSLDNTTFNFEAAGLTLELPPLALPGPSVAAGITALQLLEALPQTRLISKALANLKLPGRCQQLQWHNRTLILDVGHNPAAASYLATWLQTNPVAGKTHALVAAMNDKDLPGLLAPLMPLVEHWYPAELPGNPRAAKGPALCQGLRAAGAIAKQLRGSCQAVATVLSRALKELGAEDRLLVFGSFFTVAEALQLIRENKHDQPRL
ncbi:MAG: bifunctional tetrahydrofolate synthase/dihydrofolate synthase [Gammaproteobacteria bacterium]|nr:bifunctional tetrahydrofolate synthase/dihydrofolate synthase [Gammaproteobacteria bacterium]